MQVRAGDAAEEICTQAREHEVDLVLMEQRGLRNVKRLLLGRTVRRTLRRADVPVMVVPPNGQSSELPSYGRLLAADDFSRAGRLGLRGSIDLAVALDAQVEVIHVFRIPVMAPYPSWRRPRRSSTPGR
jgi:nucleotide-binding universal stress UspA family protein